MICHKNENSAKKLNDLLNIILTFLFYEYVFYTKAMKLKMKSNVETAIQ